MSKVAVVTDSTAYLPPAVVEQYHIAVAPQVLIWGEETFLDGVDIQPQQFYERLRQDPVMPTTSQVSVKSFYEIFFRLAEEGHEILAVLISSKLSGTIASAEQARAMLPDARIEIVDSQSTAMAMGFQVLAAARAAAEGASLEECKAIAERAREHTGVVFAVETLEFLHRGGRIGGAARLVGTLLNMKPVLELRDGRVEPVERVRTRRKSLQRVVEIVAERIGDRQPVRLATLHADAEEDARWLLEQLQARLPAVEETYLTSVSPVVGTHAGPGTVGLAYMAGM